MQSSSNIHSSPLLKSKRKHSEPDSPMQAEQVSSPSKHARRLELSSMPKRSSSFASRAQPSAGEDVSMDDGPHSASDSDEHEPQTPSFAYPAEGHYPFGVGQAGAGQHGGKGGQSQADDGMDVVHQPAVGLMGPEGKLHGPSCSSIPKIVLSHPLPSGARSLWSVCQDCGSVSPV